MGAFVIILGVIGGLSYEIKTHPEGAIGTAYKGSALERALSYIHGETLGRFDTIFDPSSAKLIPDWPDAPIYGNPPPGTPAPPLLVLDLERTLLGSTHDPRYGWRHVKRPGLDRFLASLSQYYEIVIISENDIGVSMDILAHIDPNGACHKLGASASEQRGDVLLKRLDLMNRDPARIILIDDSEEASALFPRNTLLVKPFTDVHDKSDTILLELVPLLQAFVHNDSRDFRDTIDSLGTHEAAEAVVEYRMRLAQKKMERERIRNRGLGGMVRSYGAPAEEPDEDFGPRSRILSARDIVGEAPKGSVDGTPAKSGATNITIPGMPEKPKGPSVKKTGAIASWLTEYEAAKSADAEIKNQRINELYQKREMEKAEKKRLAQQPRRDLQEEEE